MVQRNLLGNVAKEGMVINGKAIDEQQAEKYSNFFQRSFTEANIQEILDNGGGISYENFKEVAKDRMDKSMFEVAFENKWTSKRDGVIRSSKFHSLGDAVYELFPKKNRIEFRKIKYRTYESERLSVKKGERIIYNNKEYRGGRFLPKSFYYKK